MTKPLLKKELCIELLHQVDLRLKEAPGDKDLLKMRALLYNLVGKFQEAIDEIQKILNDEPNDIASRYLISDSYLNMGEHTEAKKLFWQTHFMERKEPFSEPANTYLGEEERRDMEDVLDHEKQKALLTLLNLNNLNPDS